MKIQSIKKIILAALLGIFGSAQAGLYDFFKVTASVFASAYVEVLCSGKEKEFRKPFETALTKSNYGEAALHYGKSLAIGAAALTAANYLDIKNPNILSNAGKLVLETIGGTFIFKPIVATSHKLIKNTLDEATDENDPDPVKACCQYLASLGIGFSALKLSTTYRAMLHRVLKHSIQRHARDFIVNPTVQLGQKYISDNANFKAFAPLAMLIALTHNGY